MKCSSAFSMLIAAMKLIEKFSDGSHLLDVLEDINQIEAESKYDLEKFSDGSHLLEVLEDINQIEAESKYDQEEVEGGGEDDVSAGIFTDSPVGGEVEVEGQFKVIAIRCMFETDIFDNDEIYLTLTDGKRWPEIGDVDSNWYRLQMKVMSEADQIYLTSNFGTKVCLYERDTGLWGNQDQLFDCFGPGPQNFAGGRVFMKDYRGDGDYGTGQSHYQIFFEYTGNDLGGSAVSTWRTTLNQCIWGGYSGWQFLEDEEMEIPCHENPRSLFYVTAADEIKFLFNSYTGTERCLQSVPRSQWQSPNQYSFFTCTGGDDQKWIIRERRDTTGLEIRSKQQVQGKDMCLETGTISDQNTGEIFDTIWVEECSRPGHEDKQLFKITGWNDVITEPICHPTEVSGRWEIMEGSMAGGGPDGTVEIEKCTGIETSLTQSTTSSWVQEASALARADLTALGLGGISVELETRIQTSIDNTMEYSYTKNEEECVKRVWAAGVWWQYVYDITDSHCDNNVVRGLDYALTLTASTPPCCFPRTSANPHGSTAHAPCEENMPCLCKNDDGTDMHGCSCLTLNTECNYYDPDDPAGQLECDQDPICCDKCCDGNWDRTPNAPFHYTCDYASS